MPLLTLQNNYLQVEITPEHGASIVNCAARLNGRWVPILRPTPPEALAAGNVSKMASFLLVPFSNRIPEARFQFRGKTYQLRPNAPEGYAQHGDVRRRQWDLASAGPTHATLNFDTRHFADFNYPFPFMATVRYSLDGPNFDSHFSLTNVGAEAMPVGFGFHPYFNRTLTAPDEPVELGIHLGGVYPGLVPTTPAVPIPPELDFSPMRPLGDTMLNHCFAGWDGRATIRWPRSGVTLSLEAGEPLRHVILTP